MESVSTPDAAAIAAATDTYPAAMLVPSISPCSPPENALYSSRPHTAVSKPVSKKGDRNAYTVRFHSSTYRICLQSLLLACLYTIEILKRWLPDSCEPAKNRRRLSPAAVFYILFLILHVPVFLHWLWCTVSGSLPSCML